MNGSPPRRRQAPPRGTPVGRTTPPPRRKKPSSPRRQRSSPEQKERRRRARRDLFLYALTALGLYLLFVLLAAGGILLKLHSFETIPVNEHDLFWADVEQDRFSAEIDGTLYRKEELLVGDRLYLTADLLSAYTPVSEGGNHQLRTLYLEDGEALFYLNTTTVCINGQYTSVSAPSLLRDGKLCIPLDFFTHCLSGLEVTVNEEEDRYVVQKTGEIRLNFRDSPPEEPISYESIPKPAKPNEKK